MACLRHAKPRNECRLKSVKKTRTVESRSRADIVSASAAHQAQPHTEQVDEVEVRAKARPSRPADAEVAHRRGRTAPDRWVS